VSRANNSTEVSDEVAVTDQAAVTGEAEHKYESHIDIVKGQPTEVELAALMAVLASAAGAPAEPREQEENLWGHPVDRLRYTTFSWQRVTLLERTHMRK